MNSTTDCEEYLIAGLMFCQDRQLYNRMTSTMKAEWFVNLECREMFLYLSRADPEQINPNSMAVAFEENTTWKAERFKEWLCRLIDEYPPSTLGGSLIANAKILAGEFRKRVFIEAAGNAIHTAGNGGGDYVGTLEEAIERVKRIGIGEKDELFSDQVFGVIDEVESGRVSKDGLLTGIRGLDSRAGAMLPGQLIVVGARPSVGKSMFGVVAMMAAAREGKRVYFASMEMEKAEIIARLVANEAGEALVVGQKVQAVRDAAFKVADMDVHIDDRSTLTTNDIVARINDIGEVDLVVVDYLQLLSPSGATEHREQQVSADTRALKRLAGDIHAPVVLMSQLNRKASEGVPQLSHLRESGAIEQDANKVYLLDRELDSEKLDIWIRKNRSGRQGLVECRFFGDTARILDESFFGDEG